MHVSRILTVLIIIAGVLVAACGGDDKTAAEAKADLCADLAELQTQIATLVGLGADATIEALEDQRDNVREAYDAVIDSANDVGDVETDALEEAYDNLDQSIDDIDDSMTVPDALATLAAPLAAVDAAWTALGTATAC